MSGEARKLLQRKRDVNYKYLVNLSFYEKDIFFRNLLGGINSLFCSFC